MDQHTDFMSRAPQIFNSKVVYLIETVVMEKEEAKRFSDALGSSPVLADAATISCVSRPRLWWSNIDWANAGATTRQGNCWTHIVPPHDFHKTRATDIDTGNHTLHKEMLAGKRCLPCLTTPAPTPEGRPAPPRSRRQVSDAAKRRWAADNRRFAPWHYEETAMGRTPQGKLQILNVQTKEQLQGLPIGYTAAPGVTDHARHRSLANAWRLGLSLIHIRILPTIDSRISRWLPMHVI